MRAAHGPVVVAMERADGSRSEFLAGLHQALVPTGAPLLVHLMRSRDVGVPESLVRLLHGGRARGLVLDPTSSASADARFVDLLAEFPDLPVVHLGQERVTPRGSAIRPDNELGMRLVARHVVTECGARRLLVVRGLRHQLDSAEREQALRAELAALGVRLGEEQIVDGAFSRKVAYHAVRAALTDPGRSGAGRRPDAIVAFNDRSARGALEAARDLGLRVPDDLILTGFDDEPAVSVHPSLTTVGQNRTEQGALAGQLLVDLLAGLPPTRVRTPVRLVVRDSTRPAPLPAHGLAGAAPGRAPDLATLVDDLQARLVARDLTLEISQSLLGCSTMEELVDQVAVELARFGSRQAVLVLRIEDLEPPQGFVALSYRDGRLDDVSTEQPFDLADLLPAHLAPASAAGTLVVQPLAVAGVELGYLVVSHAPDTPSVLTDVMSADLSRSIAAIRSTSRLTRQTGELEALVAERTRQLRAEVVTRRRAEDELRRLNAELRASLRVDGLTGIANRSAFEETLTEQWAGHSRSRQPLSLLMVDVDHFKAYNDRYGHLRGDEALRLVAECLRRAGRRKGDLAARYGGEEFALVLPNTPTAGALVVAGRLRDLLADAAVPHADSPVADVLTVSIGIATGHPDPFGAAADLVVTADLALYQAKHNGRNGIVVHQGDPPQLSPVTVEAAGRDGV